MNGGNQELASPIADPPTLPGEISGTTSCPFCTIEIFSDGDDQGEFFEGFTTTAGDGSFFFAGFFRGPNVTCTAIDQNDNTSEFGCDMIIHSV